MNVVSEMMHQWCLFLYSVQDLNHIVLDTGYLEISWRSPSLILDKDRNLAKSVFQVGCCFAWIICRHQSTHHRDAVKLRSRGGRFRLIPNSRHVVAIQSTNGDRFHSRIRG